MIYGDILTVGVINYNGFRNKLKGKGRIEITLDSLIKCVPEIKQMNLLLVDNESTDGSQEFLLNLPYGKKYAFERLVKIEGWSGTTRNNVENLRKIILNETKTHYYWNIENDSYFYNTHNFLGKALCVLCENPDIAIIHLRRWTPLDCRDKPGAPQNHCRVEEIRKCRDFHFYVLERSKKECVWVDVGDGLDRDFIPDKEYSFENLSEGNKPGCVRRKPDGTWQRLIEDHYNTFTNHGYIARSDCLKFIMGRYNPKSEKEMSIAFKKHFKAAKLEEDAFVCFGWNSRIKPTEEEVLKIFIWVEKGNYSSVKDYGNLKDERQERLLIT
jgi:hypothetical protein